MRRLLIMLALTAMAVLAGACGSPENGGSSAKSAPEKAKEPTVVETVRVAYKETTAERTARISYTTTTGPPTGSENSGQSSPMTMTMTGNGVTGFSGAASSLIMGMSDGDVRDGQPRDATPRETVHVKMPDELAAQMSDAKPWVWVGLDAVYEPQYGGGPAQCVASPNPTRQFEYLRGVSDSVEKVGEERVRGVPTTRYRAVTDLREEAAGQDAEVRQANEELVKRLGASKLPVEVRIDEKNRVRRYALDVSVSMSEGDTSQDASREDDELRAQMVIEYYDFGAPVDVHAPPPARTTDGTELFAGQQPAAQ